MLKNFKQSLIDFFWLVRDFLLFAKHRILGTNYAEYYAERMDRLIKRRSNWGLNQDKTFQIKYLIQHGLTPEMTFLDYGCGAVNAGLHFIAYLEDAKYTGADVSAQVLAEGKKRIEAQALLAKKPLLYHIPGGDLTPLPAQKFDMIWSYSVLTHMPPEAISLLLESLKKHMHSTSVFYADFARGETEIEHRKFKNWYYPVTFFEKTASDCGLSFTVMNDWKSPEDTDGTDTLAQFKLLN